MRAFQDCKSEQELRDAYDDLIRQRARLEAYRQGLAEELRQVMQQRAQLKLLSGASEESGSVLSFET
jgi:hypothetical protein